MTPSFITLPNESILIYVHSVGCFHHIIYSSLLGPQSRARASLVIFTYPLTHVVYYGGVDCPPGPVPGGDVLMAVAVV